MQRRPKGLLDTRAFSVTILEEGGRLGLRCLRLSYFRVGDYRPFSRNPDLSLGPSLMRGSPCGR